jgi:hypothetical protein
VPLPEGRVLLASEPIPDRSLPTDVAVWMIDEAT